MVIDEESRKRQIEEDAFQEATGNAEEEETPVPTEEVGKKVLGLGDIWELMQRSMAQNQNNFDRLDRSVTATQNEAREAKDMAARATTIACETKTHMSALEKRVAQLESGKGPGGGGGGDRSAHRHTPQGASSQGGRDWDQLGGDEGNTIALGGFRDYASKEERREEWEKMQTQIPEELRAKICETIVPNAPCSTILLKIEKSGTVTETRRAMLDWVKKFRNAPPKLTTEGETVERSFWAGPSKPYAMRQRDAKLTHTFEGLKLLAGEERAGKMHVDRASGRIFHDRTLLVQRDPETGAPVPKTVALQTLIPGYTEESLQTKIEEAKSARDLTRRPP